jgi:acyl-CoA synthetase (AMP-forming)/AMP-acid ligase II
VHTNANIVARARAIAAALLAHDVRPGDIVPILLEHRIDLQASFIGATLIGAVPTFLPPLTRKQDPDVSRANMDVLLTRIAPPCVIASALTADMLPDRATTCLNLDAQPLPEPSPTPLPDATGPAFLQHSSGTTGHKKGVTISHHAALAQITDYAAAIALAPTDCIASWLPLYHDMGLITAFLLPAVRGIPVVSLDPLEWMVRPTTLLDRIEQFAASHCWLPNFAFQHIVRLAEPGQHWNLASLRCLTSCSEPCRTRAFADFAERFALPDGVLQVSYAMAETVFAVTQTPPGQPVRASTHPA